MVEPEVLSEIVTVWGEAYVPVTGEITGVAACDGVLMVITDVAVELCVKFGAVAIAFTVVVPVTLNEPVYFVEVVVGWLPSSV
jgi:hypothetical protein